MNDGRNYFILVLPKLFWKLCWSVRFFSTVSKKIDFDFPFLKRGRNIQSICLENSWKEFYWFAKFSKDFGMRNLTFLVIRYFFQSTLKLITTKLRFLPRLGKKTHTQSISFCHASLAQFASGDDALLCCNTSLFFCVISSLWKVSLVQFFRCEIENALEALITLFQKV